MAIGGNYGPLPVDLTPLSNLGDFITDQMEKKKAGAAFQQYIAQQLGAAGGAPLAAMGAPAPTAGAKLPTFAQGPGAIGQWAGSIQGNESGGNYAAVGPTHPKLGRALGAYQVMEANVAPWTKEALGREVTPDEFLANPKIQDTVFRHKFGQYVQKYGNPQDAASAWFTGKKYADAAAAGAKDVLGTRVQDYVSKFNRGLGTAGADVPIPTLPTAAPTTATAAADLPAPGATEAQFVVPPGGRAPAATEV